MSAKKRRERKTRRQIMALMVLFMIGIRLPIVPINVKVFAEENIVSKPEYTLLPDKIELEPVKKSKKISEITPKPVQISKNIPESIELVKFIPIPEPNEYEVEMMSHLIYAEAGDQNDECQLSAGAVVLNRVKNDKYPNTIEEVIFDEGQYACTWDGNFEKEPTQQARENAYWLLKNELCRAPKEVIPINVIYQSSFEQGSGVYKIIGTQYFCYE